MVSIIRSPAISEEKRKLTTRSARARVAQAGVDVVVPSVPLPLAPAAVAPPTPPAQETVRLPVPDMNSLIEQARESVLAQFKEEADKARELGRQRGLQEGRTAGTEEAKRTFEAELARIRSIADRLQEAVETGFNGVEDMAVAIAFEALCKMLGNTAVTPEGVQALVRQAAAHAINNEKVVVRLHAGDLSVLRAVGALDATLPSGAAVSWVADKAVELGGCVVETDGGELDARLETQIEKLRKTLVAAHRQSK